MRCLKVFALTLMLCCLPSLAHAGDEGRQIQVYVNGTPVYFEIKPMLHRGTTLVQLRPFAEALGMKLAIQDTGTSRVITGMKGDTSVVLQVGNPIANVNDDHELLDVSPRQVGDSTLVPLRFVAESVGSEVLWEPQTCRIDISSGNVEEDNSDSGEVSGEAAPGGELPGEGLPDGEVPGGEIPSGELPGETVQEGEPMLRGESGGGFEAAGEPQSSGAEPAEEKGAALEAGPEAGSAPGEAGDIALNPGDSEAVRGDE